MVEEAPRYPPFTAFGYGAHTSKLTSFVHHLDTILSMDMFKNVDSQEYLQALVVLEHQVREISRTGDYLTKFMTRVNPKKYAQTLETIVEHVSTTTKYYQVARSLGNFTERTFLKFSDRMLEQLRYVMFPEQFNRGSTLMNKDLIRYFINDIRHYLRFYPDQIVSTLQWVPMTNLYSDFYLNTPLRLDKGNLAISSNYSETERQGVYERYLLVSEIAYQQLNKYPISDYRDTPYYDGALSFTQNAWYNHYETKVRPMFTELGEDLGNSLPIAWKIELLFN